MVVDFGLALAVDGGRVKLLGAGEGVRGGGQILLARVERAEADEGRGV